MILSGPEIIRERELGHISIDPFRRELVNPNSYNYRLAPELRVYEDYLDAVVSPKGEDIVMGVEGYLLIPGRLYLGRTIESMGSTHYVPSLIGRSSLGRLGLWLQVTADLGNIGSCQSWTLELKVVQPLRIYPDMRIGQVSFWSTQGEREITYQGKYQGDNQVGTSKMSEEIE